MNELFLRGNLIHKDGKKFISYMTKSREHLLPINSNQDYDEGSWVSFSGSLVTENYYEEGKRRKRYFGVGELCKIKQDYFQNEFNLSGTVSRIFNIRVTPLTKRKILDFIVASGDNYFNCIAFGNTAEMLRSLKRVGDDIVLDQAIFQSRKYKKFGKPRIAYEVCIRKFS